MSPLPDVLAYQEPLRSAPWGRRYAPTGVLVAAGDVVWDPVTGEVRPPVLSAEPAAA